MKINFKKYDIKIGYKYITQPIDRQTIGLQGTGGKSIDLIDLLKLAREVKSTALDGKLFRISITRSEKNDDLAVHEQLEFGMYPQSMPTEWTHARTLRPWQSVRLDL